MQTPSSPSLHLQASRLGSLSLGAHALSQPYDCMPESVNQPCRLQAGTWVGADIHVDEHKQLYTATHGMVEPILCCTATMSIDINMLWQLCSHCTHKGTTVTVEGRPDMCSCPALHTACQDQPNDWMHPALLASSHTNAPPNGITNLLSRVPQA